MQIAPLPAVVVLDNFASPSDVNIASRAQDVGSGWVSLAGPTNATILGNEHIVKFDQGGSTGNMVWSTNTGFANVTGYLSGHFESPHQANIGIIFRIQDSNNYTVVLVSTINNNFEIYEKIGGVFTLRDSSAIAVTYGVRYDIVAVIEGTTVTATCSVGGVLQGDSISYNALTVATGGTIHGILAAGSGTSDYVFADAPYRITTP